MDFKDIKAFTFTIKDNLKSFNIIFIKKLKYIKIVSFYKLLNIAFIFNIFIDMF